MTDTTELRGAALAYAVLDYIGAHPEEWDQREWLKQTECGTVGCLAGWAVVLSGTPVEPRWPTSIQSDLEGWGSYTLTTGIPVYDTLPDGEDGSWNRVGIRERAAELLQIVGDTEMRLFAPENTLDDLRRLVTEIFGPRPVATDD